MKYLSKKAEMEETFGHPITIENGDMTDEDGEYNITAQSAAFFGTLLDAVKEDRYGVPYWSNYVGRAETTVYATDEDGDDIAGAVLSWFDLDEETQDQLQMDALNDLWYRMQIAREDLAEACGVVD